MSDTKGRRDHYLPQAYLRGFMDPVRANASKPLWHLDVPYKKWSERSARQVGYRVGLYDHAGLGPDLDSLPSADSAFLELENEFSLVRAELLSKRFRKWRKHFGFLLRYMQMIRVRSPLFFEQKELEWKSTPTWTVKEVHPDGKTLTLTSMEASPPPASFVKNRSILQMREEIEKGGAWLWDFNWCLRYCDTVSEPFVTSEAPLAAEGPTTDIAEALLHPETLLYFPICWQACLIGSLRRFDLGTDRFGSEDMRTFRRKYRQFAQVFLLSPTKLDDISEAV